MEDLKEHIIYPLTVIVLFLASGIGIPEEETHEPPCHTYYPSRHPTAESLRREHEEWRRKQEENWANRPRYSPGDPEP